VHEHVAFPKKDYGSVKLSINHLENTAQQSTNTTPVDIVFFTSTIYHDSQHSKMGVVSKYRSRIDVLYHSTYLQTFDVIADELVQSRRSTKVEYVTATIETRHWKLLTSWPPAEEDKSSLRETSGKERWRVQLAQTIHFEVPDVELKERHLHHIVRLAERIKESVNTELMIAGVENMLVWCPFDTSL
jgi:hypothetical protein